MGRRQGQRGWNSSTDALENRIREQLGDREYALLIQRLQGALTAVATVLDAAPELFTNQRSDKNIAVPPGTASDETLAALANLVDIFSNGSTRTEQTPPPLALVARSGVPHEPQEPWRRAARKGVGAQQEAGRTSVVLGWPERDAVRLLQRRRADRLLSESAPRRK